MTLPVQSSACSRPSAVRESATGRALALRSSGGAAPAGEEADPRFFSGFPTALSWVGKGEHPHLVRTDDAGRPSCTCPWWAEYRGGRGPCKHVFAARMVRDTTKEATR